jgi:DNA-binding LacI/PurR family transcriptional regulator
MVRLSDIAEHLNLSLTTVSRALNDYSDVSSATRDLVKETARRMGYVANRSARGLALRKSHLVSLIYDDYQEPSPYQSFTFEVIAGVREFFGGTPYDLMILPEKAKSPDRESLKDLCYSRGLEGLFILGMRTDHPYLDELKEDFIPVVILDYPLAGEKSAHIQSDNLKGCDLAVDYLVSHGHQRILFINGHDSAAISRVRRSGFERALESKGMAAEPSLFAEGDYTEESGYAAVTQALAESRDFTAIFAASDLMAVGAIKALTQAGTRIPEDVAVMGFDDIFLAEHVHPTLTTVRQHKFELGFEGAKLLHQIIEDPDTRPESRTIDVELIVRESV